MAPSRGDLKIYFIQHQFMQYLKDSRKCIDEERLSLQMAIEKATREVYQQRSHEDEEEDPDGS